MEYKINKENSTVEVYNRDVLFTTIILPSTFIKVKSMSQSELIIECEKAYYVIDKKTAMITGEELLK